MDEAKIREEFSIRLRKARVRRRLRVSGVARKVNISPSTYSGYESANRFPSVETLIQLADLFEVSVDYLVGRTEGYAPMDVVNIRNYDKRDIIKYLEHKGLHWDGRILTEHERNLIKGVIETILSNSLIAEIEEGDY